MSDLGVVFCSPQSFLGTDSQEKVVILSEGSSCAVEFNTRLKLPEVRIGGAGLESDSLDTVSVSYLVTVRPSSTAVSPSADSLPVTYKCDRCHYTTNDETNYSRHIQFVHRRVGGPACDSGDSPTSKLRQKETVCSPRKNLVCPLCRYEFGVERYLRRHLSRCHKEYRPHQCDRCQFTCCTSAQLRLHVSSSHRPTGFTPHISSSQTGEEDGVQKPRSSFTCHHCRLTVKNKYNLERHIRLKHSYEGLLRCDKCEFRTTHSNFLRVHVDNVHLGLRPFRCRICDFTASHKHIMTQHTRLVHLKVKKFECRECGLRCSTYSHLKRHVAALHLKYRPNSCPLCPYSTLQNYNLCLHLNRVHSRPLPTTRKRGGYHRKDEKLDDLVRRLESGSGPGIEGEEKQPPQSHPLPPQT